MKKSVDTPFLLTFSTLIVCGLLIFTSAALGLLARDGGARFTSVAVNHLLLGLLLGGIGLVFLSRLDYRRLKPYAVHFFIFSLALTLLTFMPYVGLSLKGAARWISVGSFSFQPVEILKLATVIVLAALYSTHFKTIQTLKSGLIPLVLVAGSAGVILFLQPDTDGVLIIGMAAVSMYFAAGGRLTHIFLLMLVGIMVVAVAAYDKPYVAQRIQTFIYQAEDPLGSGYQIQQSLIAVGSGEITGRGFGQSIQKFSYLPEPIGDSVFAVAAEEFGFIGSSALVLLFMTFGVLGLRIASRSADVFGGLLVVGLVILIVGQSFFNIASSLALVPLIGVPLIFVSQGGTALAIALCEVGLILSVSRRMRA